MKWWTGNIEMVEIGGELYALDGWNGEKYLHCWKCLDAYTATPDNKKYEILPIYAESDDGEIEIKGYELA